MTLKSFAIKNRVDLTVVGPELPLTLGIVDVFEQEGMRIFGPSQKAARPEGSKIFAKEIMQKHGIPTADFKVFSDAEAAKKYVKHINTPVVIKADGLAAGKGVFPSLTVAESLAAIDRIMNRREFGEAGEKIVVQEFLPVQVEELDVTGQQWVWHAVAARRSAGDGNDVVDRVARHVIDVDQHAVVRQRDP